MAYSTSIVVHPPSMTFKLPEPYVVAYLADASGKPITESNRANAAYVRTEVFEDEDAAWSVWDELVKPSEGEPALFASCHDSHGESVV